MKKGEYPSDFHERVKFIRGIHPDLLKILDAIRQIAPHPQEQDYEVTGESPGLDPSILPGQRIFDHKDLKEGEKPGSKIAQFKAWAAAHNKEIVWTAVAGVGVVATIGAIGTVIYSRSHSKEPPVKK